MENETGVVAPVSVKGIGIRIPENPIEISNMLRRVSNEPNKKIIKNALIDILRSYMGFSASYWPNDNWYDTWTRYEPPWNDQWGRYAPDNP